MSYTPYTELSPRETGWATYPDAYAQSLHD